MLKSYVEQSTLWAHWSEIGHGAIASILQSCSWASWHLALQSQSQADQRFPVTGHGCLNLIEAVTSIFCGAYWYTVTRVLILSSLLPLWGEFFSDPGLRGASLSDDAVYLGPLESWRVGYLSHMYMLNCLDKAIPNYSWALSILVSLLRNLRSKRLE